MSGLTLISFGSFVGTIGTLIGAGGGFIMMPFLLLFYPEDSTETLTAISLAIVFANAFSGTIAYAWKGRVDFKSVIIFSIASAPGAILGSYATSLIPLKTFELGFGILMILIASYLLLSLAKEKPLSAVPLTSKYPKRILIDRYGHRYEISYHLWSGVAVSVVVGFVSSLLGIGGGVIHVPALVNVLSFPAHIATATSHGVLAFTALLGTLVHIMRGDLASHWIKIFWLTPGVLVGAQVGAHLSNRINGIWIVRLLGLALLSVGIRLVWR